MKYSFLRKYFESLQIHYFLAVYVQGTNRLNFYVGTYNFYFSSNAPGVSYSSSGDGVRIRTPNSDT